VSISRGNFLLEEKRLRLYGEWVCRAIRDSQLLPEDTIGEAGQENKLVLSSPDPETVVWEMMIAQTRLSGQE